MTERRNFFLLAAALLPLVFSPTRAAEQDTVQAIVPWEAGGRVYQVDTSTLMFVGALTGIMYVESSQGEMHEAFVMCPFVQKLFLQKKTTEAVGNCEITASPESVAYAEFTCNGAVGSCDGAFTLISGEGRFTGISGTGSLRVRSPMRALVADLAAGAELLIRSGVAVIKDLEYRIP